VLCATGSSGPAGGRWSVASGSQVGYRVREQLAFLAAESDAVGRTSQVTGAATLAGSKVTVTGKATMEFDLRLQSA